MRVLNQYPSLRTLRRVAASGVLLTGAGLMLPGCPGGAELENADVQIEERSKVDPGEDEYCNAVPIFENSCGIDSICHKSEDGGPVFGGVELIAPNVEDRLLDVPATYPLHPECASTTRLQINSAAPLESFLWTKINNTQDCGDYMPLASTSLSLADKNCVLSWMEGVIAGYDFSGTGGSTGSGGGSGSGGDAGSGGDSSSGGAAASGGDTGSGGAPSAATPIRIEAECALDFGCADGIMGAFTGEAMAENADTTVGYINDTVTLTYSNIAAAGHDTLTFYYSKENSEGALEIREGTATGTLLGTFTPTGTGAWSTWEEASVTLSAPLNGTTTLVLVGTHPAASFVANLDWIELSAGSAE